MKLNKKQKRTATIASMAALLAVVLGMGGQTFAKYITKTPATAQATVAQWGVVVNANFSKLFGTDYSGDVRVDTEGTSVNAIGENNVVAPGTGGTTTVSIEGQPEVSTKVLFDVTGVDVGIYETSEHVINDNAYLPVKWTVNDGVSDVVTAGTIADVKDYFDGLEASMAYAPKHNFTSSWTISWNWSFTGDDVKDTTLGNEAAKTSGYDDKIVTTFTFGMTISVEQVD